MCNICGLIGWIMDMIVTLITWCLSCIVIMALCVGFTVAIAAGVSYGYNYSIAEFMHSARDDVMWFMRYDPINLNNPKFQPYELRKKGPENSRKFLNIEPEIAKDIQISNSSEIGAEEISSTTTTTLLLNMTISTTTSPEPYGVTPTFVEPFIEEDIIEHKHKPEEPAVHLVKAPPIDYDDIFSFNRIQPSAKPKNPTRTTSIRKVTPRRKYKPSAITNKTTQPIPLTTKTKLKVITSTTKAATPTTTVQNGTDTRTAVDNTTTPLSSNKTSDEWIDVTVAAVYISDLYPKPDKKTTLKNKVSKSLLQDIPDYTDEFL